MRLRGDSIRRKKKFEGAFAREPYLCPPRSVTLLMNVVGVFSPIMALVYFNDVLDQMKVTCDIA